MLQVLKPNLGKQKVNVPKPHGDVLSRQREQRLEGTKLGYKKGQQLKTVQNRKHYPGIKYRLDFRGWVR